ncbi:MAG: leucine-rich repeat domain-containing protein, partial [Clostridiales bacterium]|nr:leucine-rich repeat domain-containing protein [Clostridiales bacterium]
MKQSMKKLHAIWADKRRAKTLGTVLACLTVSVAAIVAISIALPAKSLTGVPVCGFETHAHEESCYSDVLICEGEGNRLNCKESLHEHTDACFDEGRLLCGQADFFAHAHDENCYDENDVLVCSLPEHIPHAHTAECYDNATGAQICDKEVLALHTHSAGCYDPADNLVCAEVEVLAHQHNADCFIHVHTDACYGPGLVCGFAEHAHTDDCYKGEATVPAAATLSLDGDRPLGDEPFITKPDGYPVDSGQCGDDVFWQVVWYRSDDYNGRPNYKVIITGTGDMWDFVYDPDAFDLADRIAGLPEYIKLYGEYIEAFSVEGNVTSIGNYAFYGLRRLQGHSYHSYLTPNVTRIGDGAFANCGNLEGFSFHEGLESIGDRAFQNSYIYYFAGQNPWDQDPWLRFPATLQTIGEEAFLNCYLSNNNWWSSEGTIWIGYILPNVQTIGARAFAGTNLYNVTYPATAVLMGGEASVFEGTPYLTGNMPSGGDYEPGDVLASGTTGDCDWVVSVGTTVHPYFGRYPVILTISGDGAMANYGGGMPLLDLLIMQEAQGEMALLPYLPPWMDLTGSSYNVDLVVVEEGVTHIGDYAFIVGPRHVTLPSSLTSIGTYALFSAELDLEEFVIPEGVTHISEGAFAFTRFYRGLKLPETLIHIGDYAFSGGRIDESFAFPDSLAYIGKGAFMLTEFNGGSGMDLTIPGGCVIGDGGTMTMYLWEAILNEKMGEPGFSLPLTLEKGSLGAVTWELVLADLDGGGPVVELRFSGSGPIPAIPNISDVFNSN